MGPNVSTTPNPEQRSALLSPDDVAARLGIGRRRVYDLVKFQQLPAYKLGQQLRIDPDELAAWLDEQRTAGAS